MVSNRIDKRIDSAVYVCNLCDKGFEDIDKFKKHLICKHKDAIVALSSNAQRVEYLRPEEAARHSFPGTVPGWKVCWQGAVVIFLGCVL